MFTFKQLEALYWVGTMGGFAHAADRLNTTQSAISKRIQDLEHLFDTPLFDRSGRTAKLTEKGEEMLTIAKGLLDHRDTTVEHFSRPEIIERTIRIGVTELTAMTWLPRFVERLRAKYPRAAIEPIVDLSVKLRDEMVAGRTDVIIVPNAFSEPSLGARRLRKVENAWMCSPSLLPAGTSMRAHQLSGYTMLAQGNLSGTGIFYQRWLRTVQVPATNSIVSNSLLALIGMTVSGLGLSYLPVACVGDLIERRLLQIVRVTPSLPDITYVAMYSNARKSALVSSIIAIAAEVCDFSSTFQVGMPTTGRSAPKPVRSVKDGSRKVRHRPL